MSSNTLFGRRRSRNIWLRAAMVAALLLLHFLTRFAADSAYPLQFRMAGMYGEDFRVSINLIAGRGFRQSTYPDAPEAAPLRAFTSFKRDEVTPAELAAFLRQPWSQPIDFNFDAHTSNTPISSIDRDYINEFYTMRALDLRLAALLWKIFGIRWSVYFTFYKLVSTFAALMIFLIGRRTGGYWTGVLALLLFTACPLENQMTVFGVRDISPLWFTIIAFAALFCLAGRFRNRTVNLASYGFAGFVALLGYGWRIDALMIPVILLCVMIVDALIQHRNLRTTAIQTGCFAAGALLCFGFIVSLTPQHSVSPGIGIVTAYYGNAERSNLSGVENSAKIFREDLITRLQARYYADANHMPPIPPGNTPYLSRAFGGACRAMYIRALKLNAFHWISGFPHFTFRAMRATALIDLPVNGGFLPKRLPWPAWIRPVGRILLDRVGRITPWLALLGIAAVLFWVRVAAVPCSMAALVVFYAMLLFAVLPEYTHSGLLAFPVCMLGAIGVMSLFSRSLRQNHWKAGIAIVAAAGILWGAASVAAYFWSVQQRAAQVAAIRGIVTEPIPDNPETRFLPQLFLLHRTVGSLPDRAGYLLEIQTGTAPGLLEFRERRESNLPRCYYSLHRLQPARKQYFFFTSYQGALDGSLRSADTVLLSGDARILSVRRADLTNWTGLEASTVFYDGEHSPGSPVVGLPAETTVYNLGSADVDLLSSAEHKRFF